MKLENNIKWCDVTTNALTGCSRVSEGCRFCYAESGTRARVLRSQGIETWGSKGVRHAVNFEPVFRRLNKSCVCDKCHNLHPVEYLDYPDESPRLCVLCGGKIRKIRLFADSNSDWLDERWPIETLARFLDTIRQAPNVETILLTKRIENFYRRLNSSIELFPEGHSARSWLGRWCGDEPPPHIWLGVSCENQVMADKRIPELLKIPAAFRFLSCEPLLEMIDLRDIDVVDWVIVGGESGPNRRDCGIESIISVADQCVAAGVPVYVKQASAFKSGQQGAIPDKYWALKQFLL